ncbi:MAG TPA: DUF397 domain-containing protein [Pseudonocardiaceae bacterium]|jgi:hypothetical protein
MPKVTREVWRKSSYSGGSGNTSCVEVAFVADAVGVRDSKNTQGPTLAFAQGAWRGFVTGRQALATPS